MDPGEGQVREGEGRSEKMGSLESYSSGHSRRVINVEVERERLRISSAVADDVTKVCLREVSQVSLSSTENMQRLRNECSICLLSHQE